MSDKPTKSRRSLPRLRRAKSVEEESVKPILGTSNSSSPFGNAITIQDDVGDIPSAEELRKQNKGKSNLSLGQKYGGRRKAFLLLSLLLLGSLLLSLFNTLALNSKVSKSAVKDEVASAVQDSTSTVFPVGQASMWVDAFVRIYGTWDYKTPGARAADLSPYLAPGMDAQAGWDGKGTQKVIYSSVSPQPMIIDRSRAMFDTTYQIQDGTWRCAQVPVFAYKPTDAKQGPTNQWGFAVTANPTPVPCALRVSVPGFNGNNFKQKDAAAAETLKTSFFPGFFNAWVTSDADTLRQYMAPTVTTFGLGGAYQGNPTINDVVLPIGDTEKTAQSHTVYTAYVTVTMSDFNGSKVTATYKVPVSSNGSQWQVMGEPQPIVQALNNSGNGNLGGQPTTNPSSSGNPYAQPDQTSGAQPNQQTPTVASPSAPASSASPTSSSSSTPSSTPTNK